VSRRTLRILGTRGVPAAHGGFETFAEQLSLYLVRRGWRVIVYCQEDGAGDVTESTWCGVERVTIPISQKGPPATILFDWKSIRHAAKFNDLCLTLGYNTAALCAWLRLKGIRNLINMDGVEWRRAKWGRGAKAWFWLNDWAGCWLANHLIADHPEIARHLETRVSRHKITTIAYGAKQLKGPGEGPLRPYGLKPGGYITLVARAEPENSVLEIIQGFSRRPRGVRLVVLGQYFDYYPYHAKVKAAASDEVTFLGAIYEKSVLESLRYHGLAYLHGHQVGGTNPSLVEAMGAGNAVIAHDNRFNHWVAGDGARYFRTADDLDAALTEVLAAPERLAKMRASSVVRVEENFTWESILTQYEALLDEWLPRPRGRVSRPAPPPRAIESMDLEPRYATGQAQVRREGD
jgi:glycosyltransferase involved in cell wall biosynthesis